MKKVLFALFLVICFNSCKKCYTCRAKGAVAEKQTYQVCNGSIEYRQIQNGINPTDYNGQELHCY